MLGYVIRKGNTTVYEWRTGSEPKKIERPKQNWHSFGDDDEQQGEGSNKEDTIDFGDFDIKPNDTQDPVSMISSTNELKELESFKVSKKTFICYY